MPRASARRCLAFALALSLGALGLAHAQVFNSRDVEELKAPPPPPAFDVDRALPIDVPVYSAIDFLLDPETISIGADGVVRFVVIGRSKRRSDTLNAFYQGMRCSQASIKTYATSTGSADGWSTVKTPEWKHFSEMRSTYGVELARQAICRGDAPRESVRDMVDHLKQPYQG